MEKSKAEALLLTAVPPKALAVMERLEQGGAECWFVGGSIRDTLLGLCPQDWDIASSLPPEKVAELFSDCTVIPTGERHGTMTVVWEGTPFEITMYRVEEGFDGRRPAQVHPARNIGEDLRRRDFTINAMAFHPVKGLLDEHGGLTDLKEKRICTVGEPEQRFREDYLRILRGLRFASCLGFTLEEKTAQAMDACADGMKQLSGERIWQELERLLLGEFAGDVLAQYGRAFRGFGESWSHFSPEKLHAARIQQLPSSLPGRLGAVLDWGLGPERLPALMKLRCPARCRDRVLSMWNQGETLPNGKEELPLWLSRFSRESRWEDCLNTLSWQGRWDLVPLCRKLRQEALPLCPGELAVSGKDLLSAGVEKGPAVGQMLHHLLEAVWSGAVPNSREALLPYITAENENGLT